MSHINGITVTTKRVNRGRVTNIPSKGLKDRKKNETDAVKREVERVSAGGRPRADFGSPTKKNIARAVRVSRVRSAASGRKGSEAQKKLTRLGKKRFR